MATLLSTQTLKERLNPILTSAGYAPYASLQLSGEPQTLMQQLAKDVPALWMGTPWGSLSFFGVRQADRLDQTSLAQLMDRAFKVALGLLPSTGQLTFKAGLGARSVGLGVYGRILFVWESTPNLAIGKVQYNRPNAVNSSRNVTWFLGQRYCLKNECMVINGCPLRWVHHR